MLMIGGIKKSYGDHSVLNGLSFVVEPGEIASLLGPNGAGKTTLLSIIAGLQQADVGEINICGHDLRMERKAAVTCLGMAQQETSVHLALTTRENLQFFAELHGVARRDRKLQVQWAIETLELGPFADRPAQKLSGGERRRLHTAVAMIGRPKVLLLDEPTVGSDIETRARLLEVVRGLANKGTAVVYTTHYLPEVVELGARVMILDGGVLIADGALQALLARHAADSMELTFNGPAPLLTHPLATITTQGSVVHVQGRDTTRIAHDLLAQLEPGSPPLARIEMLQGSLDSAYLSLTGRRYTDEGAAARDTTSPAGSSARSTHGARSGP